MAEQKKKIAVLQGGLGAERDISLLTGEAFAQALDELGYSYSVLDSGPDLPIRLSSERPDVALLALHGKFAEDGTVQGICEYLKIPYTGSGVLASALCMNKWFTKKVLKFHGVPSPEHKLVDPRRDNINTLQLPFDYPVVVKPSREGSSVAVRICHSKDELFTAVEEASSHDNDVLLERFIKGRELTISILGDNALTPIEIAPKEGFYDYKNKYTAGNTDYILPPNFEVSLIKECQEMALTAASACDVRAYCRVDFRVDEHNSPYVIEINTLPGCTPTSLLPKAALHDGISFSEVVRTIVEKAGLDYEGLV